MREGIRECLTELKRFSASLADCLTFSEDLLDSMIAPYHGNLYGNIQSKIYSEKGVFERISNWKNIVQKNMSPKL